MQQMSHKCYWYVENEPSCRTLHQAFIPRCPVVTTSAYCSSVPKRKYLAPSALASPRVEGAFKCACSSLRYSDCSRWPSSLRYHHRSLKRAVSVLLKKHQDHSRKERLVQYIPQGSILCFIRCHGHTLLSSIFCHPMAMMPTMTTTRGTDLNILETFSSYT